MNHTPKVSIIVPVYNVERYLGQCLHSLLAQTLQDIEIICIDDGSTDNSLSILERYALNDKRVKIISQRNLGAGAARNRGMREAIGEYLLFMDSDDYCTKDFLKRTVEHAEEKNAEIVVYNYCKFDEQSGKEIYCDGLVKARCPLDKDVFSYRDIPEYICNVVNPTPWNKLYKHSFVKERHLQWLEVSTTNDITFATLSVMMADRIAYLNETFMFYRVNVGNSITSRKKYRQDNVIDAVLNVDKQAQSLEYYELVKNSIREFVVENLLNSLRSYTPDEESIYHIEFRKKIEAIFYSYPLFFNYESYKLRDKQIYEQLAKYRLRAMRRQDFSFAPRIIVSLTSFPQRINTVYIALSSIYQQTQKPDKVMLWLAEEQFPNKEADLPLELLDYKEFGLEIRWCKEDLRPHKKYLYAMQEYPEDIIITIDDDLIYDSQMIERLFESYMRYPYAVSTVRTHLINADEQGRIAPYSAWTKEFSGVIGVPSMQLFATSGAGTLFPPHCMDREVFNVEKIKDLCLNADDLWLKIMQVRKGTPVVLVDENRLLRYISNTQDVALRQVNVYKDGNDGQLAGVLAAYDPNNEYAVSILGENIGETTTLISDFVEDNQSGVVKNDALLRESQRCLENAEKELRDIKASWGYKIGQIITYFPRRYRVMLHSIEEFGVKYTICRFKDKIMAFVKRRIKH